MIKQLDGDNICARNKVRLRIRPRNHGRRPAGYVVGSNRIIGDILAADILRSHQCLVYPDVESFVITDVEFQRFKFRRVVHLEFLAQIHARIVLPHVGKRCVYRGVAIANGQLSLEPVRCKRVVIEIKPTPCGYRIRGLPGPLEIPPRGIFLDENGVVTASRRRHKR